MVQNNRKKYITNNICKKNKQKKINEGTEATYAHSKITKPKSLNKYGKTHIRSKINDMEYKY